MDTIQLKKDDNRVGKDGALPKVDVFGNAYQLNRVVQRNIGDGYVVVLPPRRVVQIELLPDTPKGKKAKEAVTDGE